MNPPKFYHFKNNPYRDNSLQDNHVLSFSEDNDSNIWIGTNKGFDKFNFDTGDFIHFNINNNSQIDENFIYTLYKDNDRDNILWIGSYSGGLFKLNILTGNIKHFIKDLKKPNTLLDNRVVTLKDDLQGNILIGTEVGVCKLNKITEKFSYNVISPIDSAALAGKRVSVFYKDKNDIYWVGTPNGLLKINKDGTYVKYINDEDDSTSISKGNVTAICEDKNKNLWIGTDHGINLLDQNIGHFTNYSINEGLLDNQIQAMLTDNENNLWLSTQRGLIKFKYISKNNFEVKNYDANDGVDNYNFSDNSALKTKDGILFFGGMNGFNFFNPSAMNENKNIPSVAFTSFKKFDEEFFSIDKLLKVKTIELDYSDKFFSFEFAALDFTEPTKNRYAYKMEGFNKRWIQSGTKDFASYTNLDPGTYTFKVKGCNNDGIWSVKEASIQLIISPPWWRTWWAYLIYFSVFIAGLITVRRYEVNRIKLKNDLKLKEFETNKLNEVDKLKSRFFANISHEFRTPLTLILGILEKYLKKSNEEPADFKVMKKNAQRLLQLINQILELSKIESGSIKLKVQKTEIYHFIRRIVSSFISLADHNKIDLKFNNLPLSDNTEMHELIVYIDREKMETVIYNLLSNALKFTPSNEKVSVNLNSNETEVEIKVTNTGISIPKEKLPYVFDRFYQVDESGSKNYEGTGIGLALSKELVELHHGKIEVESLPGVETTFQIIIPLGDKLFTRDQIYETNKNIVEEENDLIEVGEEKIKSVSKESKLSSGQANLVLVVEDHFDLRNFICEQLEDDYTVVEAEDGEKGLQLAEELIPDLIVSDIMMPKMDGYDLCKELKSNIKTNHIPVILLTAKAAIENKLEGLEIGADDYLIKPFNTEELKARVKNLIQIRQKMREKFQAEMILKAC